MEERKSLAESQSPDRNSLSHNMDNYQERVASFMAPYLTSKKANPRKSKRGFDIRQLLPNNEVFDE